MLQTKWFGVFGLFVLYGLSSFSYADFTEIRLVGGDTPNIGLVEIKGPKGWGTICTDDGSWDTESARVICNQLGYSDVVMAQEARVGQYGYTMGPSYITNVECGGDENALKECTYQTYRGKVCNYEAAVFCTIPGYVGCYHMDRLLSNELITVDLMDLDYCLQYCSDKHYYLASLQYSTCHCSNGGDGLREAMSSSCNLPCPGSFHHLCGGTQFYSVYDTTLGYCTDPGTPRFGFKEVSSYRFGGYATFACRIDLWLIGEHTIQCVIGDNPDEVTWGDDIPQCSDTPPPTKPELPFMTSTSITTMASEGSVAAGHNPDQPDDTKDSPIANENIAWICLLLLPVVVTVTLVFIFRKKKLRSTSDENGNQQVVWENIPELIQNPVISKGASQHDLAYKQDQYEQCVSPTSKTSSEAYAEIGPGEAQQHVPAGIIQNRNGIATGVTQHDITYNDEDRTIQSSLPEAQSYAEIDEAAVTSSNKNHKDVKEGTAIGHSLPEMSTNDSYAEIEDLDLKLAGNNDDKMPPDAVKGNSYAEIKDDDLTPEVNMQDGANNKMAGNTYQSLSKPHNSSSTSYAEIDDNKNKPPRPKESVASYMSFETPQNEQSAKNSTASYISFEASQPKSPSANSASSTEGSVFYDEKEQDQNSQRSSKTASDSGTSLPTISEGDDTLRKQMVSRVSSTGSVENIIYESGDATL